MKMANYRTEIVWKSQIKSLVKNWNIFDAMFKRWSNLKQSDDYIQKFMDSSILRLVNWNKKSYKELIT
jgi:hypothetical protein